MKTKVPMSFRIDAELAEHLRAAAEGRLAPSQTRLVERGIILALKELSGLSAKRRKQNVQ